MIEKNMYCDLSPLLPSDLLQGLSINQTQPKAEGKRIHPQSHRAESNVEKSGKYVRKSKWTFIIIIIIIIHTDTKKIEKLFGPSLLF